MKIGLDFVKSSIDCSFHLICYFPVVFRIVTFLLCCVLFHIVTFWFCSGWCREVHEETFIKFHGLVLVLTRDFISLLYYYYIGFVIRKIYMIISSKECKEIKDNSKPNCDSRNVTPFVILYPSIGWAIIRGDKEHNLTSSVDIRIVTYGHIQLED